MSMEKLEKQVRAMLKEYKLDIRTKRLLIRDIITMHMRDRVSLYEATTELTKELG